MNPGSPSPRPETARLLDESTGPLDPGRWVDLYGDYVYRMAIVRLRDARSAEELTQRILIEAMRARRFFQDPAMEKLWLAGIFKNHLHQHLTHAVESNTKVNLRFYEDRLQSKFTVRVDGKYWKDGTSIEDLDLSERSELSHSAWTPCLNEAMRKMEWPAFVVLTLRDVDGLSLSEIGQILGLSVPDVIESLYRARMALRDLVQDEWQSVLGNNQKLVENAS